MSVAGGSRAKRQSRGASGGVPRTGRGVPTALVALGLLCALGCAPKAEQPGAGGQTGAGAAAAGGGGGGAASAGGAGGTAGGSSICPGDDFEACGGNVVGTWQVLAFCPPEGRSLTTPCDHPFGDEPACAGPPNAAECTNVYGGTLVLAPDGKATLAMELHGEMTIELSASCVLAVGKGGDAAAACASLSNDKLDCQLADALCVCHFATEPEKETIEDVYQVAGNSIIIAPNSVEPITGPYCVDAGRLTIANPIGWRFWVLESRPE